MPHKMNTRSCERVNGLAVVLRGHLSMVGRAGRRPVERGRRLLLGRTPGGAARRVLRHRRALPDVPHRARRVRGLPGGDPARARPLPAVPGDDQGADRGRARRGRPRAGARGDQGARRRRRPRDAPGARPTTTSSTASPPTRGSASTAPPSRAWSATRSSSPAPPAPRPPPSYDGWSRSSPATRPPRRTHPTRSSEGVVRLSGTSRGHSGGRPGLQAPRSRSSLASRRWTSARVAASSSGRRSTTIVPPGSSSPGPRRRSCRRSAGGERPPCRSAEPPRGAGPPGSIGPTWRGPWSCPP